jgi:large subunit ribosomal protein L13
MNKTYIPSLQNQNKWYLIDAKGKNLGRLSTVIANILRGKNNPEYTPSLDCGDHIIIINTQAIVVTGQKKSQKIYYRHSGRPGGLKTETFDQLQERLPNKIIETSVRKMLPKGPLGRQLFKKLKAYPEGMHPHEAQNPKTLQI